MTNITASEELHIANQRAALLAYEKWTAESTKAGYMLYGGIPLGRAFESFTVRFGAEDGDFTYPGGSYDDGEKPIDKINLMTIYDAGGAQLATYSGFSLTLAQILAVKTEADFRNVFFASDDQLFGGGKSDRVDAWTGNDTVFGGGGADVIHGGDGKDYLNGDAGRDVIFGDAGRDTISGGDGLDRLFGGADNDVLSGGNDRDTVSGGQGNDRISGGFGADDLRGGSGRDVFLYQTLPTKPESGPSPTARDVIRDFKHGQDKIDISFIQSDAFEFIGEKKFTHAGGEVRYLYSGGDTIVAVNADHDLQAEISIRLEGHLTLSALDFVL